MANPDVELVWGGYGWPKNLKRVVKPHVESAVELAHAAVEEMGITYHSPKRAHIRRCGRAVISQASSMGDTNIELFIRQDLIRHRKVGNLCSTASIETGHELIHAARHERFAIWDLAEEIASEGLAHAAEDNLRIIMGVFDDGLGAYGASVDPHNANLFSTLSSDLVKDLAIARGNDEVTDELAKYWFNCEFNEMDTGTIMGLMAVYQHLIEGRTIAEMMDWPADQILQLDLAT